MSIQVRHVTKTFGQYAALKDVNLDIPDGELVALLGPSGSGKTTLLRIIAGLEVPDANPETQILFHDQDVAARAVGDRRVGFVFQHYALFRHMSVFDNIAFGLRVRPRASRPSKGDIRARVHELLKLIQLENLGDRYPSELSGGQRQRVALARALAIEPKVLLLDEPFGALDAKVRQGLRRWLRDLHDKIHITSVLVTHDQEEALEVADRVVVMRQARIEQQGTPEEVFHHPASEFVMDFLGHVNLFHGRVDAGRAVFDGLAVDHAAGDAANGKAAKLLVRPHELELFREPNGNHSVKATVTRVHRAGPSVKVELNGPEGRELFVELTHERFAQAPVAAGDTAYVSPRATRVFVQDFSI
ncbi:MAG: sulfate ABC transporter ATP-binding protein [Planctomycetota bacterium]|nr:sulfate ABC transporter ATP-binding protein [Planctomycetota bacterium]